ncbi:redox-sensing transcriptional repressor [Desulfonispora thiosulfatigenes DSM 11270]|uniref:Redox-sensing transcriptional repressor Rex n=1 Tax=Desulfonispora thiosulfatigenes DSM 11270 TaxID=656914 RepID=A0A1W1VGD3_DESTI|nr:redox-sensing transcriptional repressor Rex [Desulfonispora thiosulfatigenes]SMB92131.1 redox-sensing transcriptional repressor [Desulfonispora thiosulfatigenes DSM 11270]
MKSLKIPEATVMRLSVYSRFLTRVQEKGVVNISSGEIAEGIGGSPAQVRKDLAYFGEFGTRGVGYNANELNHHIMKILGLGEKWPVAIIGAGNLGSALTQYKGFIDRGFKVVAIFDNDLNKIGLTLNGIPVYSIADMEKIIRELDVKIAIIAVPAEHAQGVADHLANCNVMAILNFAQHVISVPEHIELRNVDLAVNLEILTFNLSLQKEKDKEK